MSGRERLRIVRRFDVPPRSVFDAFTDPDAMRVWWTPDTVFDLDVRVGGRWRITRRDGDETLVMEGSYLEVEPPTRLRFTIAMPQYAAIADELRSLPAGATSASEAGW